MFIVQITVRNLFCCHRTVRECTTEDLCISPSGPYENGFFYLGVDTKMMLPQGEMHPKRHTSDLQYKHLYNRCYDCPLPSNLTFCRARPSWRQNICLNDTYLLLKKKKKKYLLHSTCEYELWVASSDSVIITHRIFGHSTWIEFVVWKIKIYFFNLLFSLSCKQSLNVLIWKVAVYIYISVYFKGSNVHAFAKKWKKKKSN